MTQIKDPSITVEAHSDDHAVNVIFDGRAWFRNADLNQIISLARIEFRGDYAADALYHHAEAAGNEDVAALVTYLDTKPVMANGDSCGFEVVVDEDEAMAWLASERHDVHAAVLAARFLDNHPDTGVSDLDELVHETAGKSASGINNDGSSEQLSYLGAEEVNPGDFVSGELDSDVNDAFEARASEINNQGAAAQLAYLFENGWNAEEILTAIGDDTPNMGPA